MAYTLIYTRAAGKDIRKLDGVTRKKLGKKLLAFQENPFLAAKKLEHTSFERYRVRIGNYRIIFAPDGQTIVILRVRHRREVYKNS